MKVELLRMAGSDLDVVNAARVSFDKESTWEYEELDSHFIDFDGTTVKDRVVFLSKKDEKLIKYLTTHNHWSPFTHCFATFRITAPIFVARQLAKHQVGLAWNEVSRRYVDNEPEFYMPEKWRGKALDKKQGSSDVEITELQHEEDREDLWGPFDNKWHPSLHVQLLFDSCKWLYDDLIKSGVAPEQARMVLPQSTYTSWIWSGSMYAFARVCNLRCKSDAQLETKMIADMIDKQCAVIWPVSWKALRVN